MNRFGTTRSAARSPLHARILGALAESICNYALALRQRLARRRHMGRTLFMVLCLGCTLAAGQSGSSAVPASPGQGAASGTTGAVPLRADELPAILAANVTEKLAALTGNEQLRRVGTLIAAFFLAALLVWTAVKSMAGGKGMGELLGEWIPIFVAFGIVTLFMDRGAGNLIVTTMDGVTRAIAGQDMSSLKSALDAGITQILRAISAMLMQPSVTDLGQASGGLLDRLTHVAVGSVSLVLGALARLAAAFCLVLAGVVMASHIIMGYVSVQLVLALAPIMVPFLMFKPMEWLFNSWLKFLLGSCMLKVVLAFLLTVASALLTSTGLTAERAVQSAVGASAGQAFVTDMLLLGMTVVFAAIATLLVMQAPRIADGLLSGAASGAGFAGIRGVTQSAGARMLGDVGIRAGGSIAQDFRNKSSSLAGMHDARSGKPPSLAYRDARAKAAYDTAYRDNSRPPN